ncbi:fumarylacetoacetate hydrolase family protein [Streptomyces sp. CA-111067]|uniref:fumarylacetoacetate hydrolase family protein n=1 Tax=Streptomyces sp. CA-111067 TaxID=3240046 RepID=UPI003D953358
MLSRVFAGAVPALSQKGSAVHLIRFVRPGKRPAVGVVDADGITAVPDAASMADLLTLRQSELKSLVASTARAERIPLAEVEPLPPIDGRTEVWGSRVARPDPQAGRPAALNPPAIHDAVYDAERPELYFKSVPWRIVTDDEPGGIRRDAVWSVPEPQLALVVNRYGEIVGATVCDDLTARSIEHENPLYLAQAKVYAGSCVLASRIRPWWEIADPTALETTMTIHRGGGVRFRGTAGTAEPGRWFADLIVWLFREQNFPDGVVLATGSAIVPPPDVTLDPGDRIEITIDEVGTLTHSVVCDPAAFQWLGAPHDPAGRRRLAAAGTTGRW